MGSYKHLAFVAFIATVNELWEINVFQVETVIDDV